MNKLVADNYIESKYKEILANGLNDPEYLFLYQEIENEKLRLIFAALHKQFEVNFQIMNRRLPTGENGNHFWAEPSRSVKYAVDMALGLERALKGSYCEFAIDTYYFKILTECKKFLRSSGGSSLPPNMDEVVIYHTLPIFRASDSNLVVREGDVVNAKLSQIGEGSYAIIYKFKDEFYDRHFAIKRAKKGLNTKELARFKNEFEEMKKLSSPYILEVFKFNEEKNEYVMEFMDSTLGSYINVNNNKLTVEARKKICFQILRGFEYLHSKNLIHRDISPSNILLRNYDGLVVVKISDFGLVKAPENDLTSFNTEMKGAFNDPALNHEGWATYGMLHETYALTMLLHFVMTGRRDVSSIRDPKLNAFVKKGLHAEKSNRYKNIRDVMQSFRECVG